jgi:hypothetical protein
MTEREATGWSTLIGFGFAAVAFALAALVKSEG